MSGYDADCVGHMGDENLASPIFAVAAAEVIAEIAGSRSGGANEPVDLISGTESIFYPLPDKLRDGLFDGRDRDLGDCQTLNSDCIERFLNGVRNLNSCMIASIFLACFTL